MSTLYGMRRLEQITSPANALVKEIRKAATGGTVMGDGCCVAEGFHLLTEAIRSKVAVEAVVFRAGSALQLPPLPLETRMIELPDALFDSIAATETSQGVLSLVRLPQRSEAEILGVEQRPALVIVLDGVQDPGNAGTIVRTAEAFGATGIIFGRGTARPENPKTLRASAGSLFRVPFLAAKNWWPPGLKMLAAMPSSGRSTRIDDVDYREPCSIVVGSEGQGIGEFYLKAQHVAIPTRGVESLNAAVAASILLYEAARQREKARA